MSKSTAGEKKYDELLEPPVGKCQKTSPNRDGGDDGGNSTQTTTLAAAPKSVSPVKMIGESELADSEKELAEEKNDGAEGTLDAGTPDADEGEGPEIMPPPDINLGSGTQTSTSAAAPETVTPVKLKEGGSAYSEKELAEEKNDAAEGTLEVGAPDADKEKEPEIMPPPDINLSRVPTLLASEIRKDDEKAVEEALREIANLCFKDGTAKATFKSLVKFGAHLLIIQTMRKWYKYPRIQSQGCRVLVNARSHLYRKDDEEFRQAAVQIGAFETVLLALKNFPDDQVVQHNGSAALDSLSQGIPASTKRLVRELDGAKAIVTAMTSFPDFSELQQVGSSFFFNAGQWHDCRKAVVKAGALSALASAVENTNERVFKEDIRKTMVRLTREPFE
jgi:hypothetical protein